LPTAFGHVRPEGQEAGKFGVAGFGRRTGRRVEGRRLAIKCAGFCAALGRNSGFLRGWRRGFDPPWWESQVLAAIEFRRKLLARNGFPISWWNRCQTLTSPIRL